MELQVGGVKPLEVVSVGGGFHRFHQLSQQMDGLACHLLNGKEGSQALQLAAHNRDLPNCLLGDVTNTPLAVWLFLEESLCDKGAQRFTHRATADVKLLCEVTFGQFLSNSKSAVENR